MQLNWREKTIAILEELASGHSLSEACARLGMARESGENYLRSFTDALDDAYDRQLRTVRAIAEEVGISQIETRVIQAHITTIKQKGLLELLISATVPQHRIAGSALDATAEHVEVVSTPAGPTLGSPERIAYLQSRGRISGNELEELTTYARAQGIKDEEELRKFCGYKSVSSLREALGNAGLEMPLKTEKPTPAQAPKAKRESPQKKAPTEKDEYIARLRNITLIHGKPAHLLRQERLNELCEAVREGISKDYISNVQEVEGITGLKRKLLRRAFRKGGVELKGVSKTEHREDYDILKSSHAPILYKMAELVREGVDPSDLDELEKRTGKKSVYLRMVASAAKKQGLDLATLTPQASLEERVATPQPVDVKPTRDTNLPPAQAAEAEVEHELEVLEHREFPARKFGLPYTSAPKARSQEQIVPYDEPVVVELLHKHRELLKTYDEDKLRVIYLGHMRSAGRKSPRELGRLVGLKLDEVLRILDTSGYVAAGNHNDYFAEQGRPPYDVDAAIRRGHGLKLSETDVAYFLDQGNGRVRGIWTRLGPRKQLSPPREKEHTMEWRQVSSVYQARDAHLTEPQLAELLEIGSGDVAWVLEKEDSFGKKLEHDISALLGAQADKPYVTAALINLAAK